MVGPPSAEKGTTALGMRSFMIAEKKLRQVGVFGLVQTTVIIGDHMMLTLITIMSTEELGQLQETYGPYSLIAVKSLSNY